ncbi:hypothetical protein QOT17_011232 [Balamuthia mandrillaris]
MSSKHLLFLGVVVLLATLHLAHACSAPIDYVPPSIAERVEAADLVIIATTEWFTEGRAILGDVAYYKGDCQRESWLMVHNFGNGADCLSTPPPVGSEAIFFINEVEDECSGETRLELNHLGIIDAVIYEDFIEEAEEEILPITGAPRMLDMEGNCVAACQDD